MSGFSRNPFALLSDETDDAAPAAAKSTPAAAPAKTIPGQAPKKPQQQSQRGGRGDYPSRGGARNVYKAPEAAEAENGREDRGDRGRGRGAGRGGPRGAGRGRGRGGFKNDRPDRHSQTGVHDTDKRVASGWGADEGDSELRAEKEGEGDAKAAAATDGPAAGDGWDAPAAAPAASGEDSWAAGADGAGESKAVEEEVDNSKTYEEYLAERAAAVKLAPAKAARQANEGTDDSQWKDGVQLVREANEDDDWFMGVKTKKEGASKKSKNEKTFIEIEPQGYRPPRSDRGDRGGRGGGRGRGEGRGRGAGAGGPRGAPRGARGGFGGRGGPRELDPEDSNAFPSLS